MASKKSIGQLHATVTADAAQFVNEFNRADNAARRHGAAISREVEKVSKDIRRDFSAGKLAKGFLGGLGIGSGIEVARIGFEFLQDVFNAPAKGAKEVAEYVSKMRADLESIHERRFQIHLEGLPVGAQPQALSGEVAEQQKKLAQAIAEREQARADYRRTTESDFQAGSAEGMALKDKYGMGFWEKDAPWYKVWKITGAAAIGSEAQGRIDEAQSLVDAHIAKIEALKSSMAKAVEGSPRALDSALTEMFKELDTVAKDITAQRAAFERSVEGPQDKLRNAARDAWNAFNAGSIDEQLRDRLIGKADRDFVAATKPDMGIYEKAAGALRADELTRRGLGTGADYGAANKQTESLLAEIRDILRRAAANGIPSTLTD